MEIIKIKGFQLMNRARNKLDELFEAVTGVSSVPELTEMMESGRLEITDEANGKFVFDGVNYQITIGKPNSKGRKLRIDVLYCQNTAKKLAKKNAS